MTSHGIYDRLVARTVSTLPPEPLLGRYLVCGERVLLNGLPTANGDFVVADADWRISMRFDEGPPVRAGLPVAERPPEDETADALREIAELFDCVSDLTDLRDCSPLASPDPERSRATQLDIEIGEGEPHLLGAAHRPHTRLEARVERMPVARAKRVPPRAIEHLAAHSEDWQRRTPSRVVPRKVLATRLDEQLDIYENRVASRLTDRVLMYLRARISGLTKISEIYEDVREFHRLLGGRHQLVKRLSELWSTRLMDAASDERPESLAGSLAAAHRRVSGVLSSPMYRAVPRLATVERSLRATNVLASRQDYRRVAALWRVLDDASDITPDALTWQRQEQHRCEDFDAYCRLLVLRALDDDTSVRWNAQDWGTPPGDRRRWRLEGWIGPLELRVDRLDGITLATEDQLLLRLVPLVGSITGLSPDGIPEPTRVLRRLHEVTATPDSGALTVGLYLGTRKEREGLPDDVACAANPVPDLAEVAHCLALPVSPFDLLSLERVARLIRWILSGGRMLAYPPQVTCRRSVRPQVAAAADWVDEAPGDLDHLRVLAEPDQVRLRQLGTWLDAQRRGLRPKHDDAQRESLDAIVEELGGKRIADEFAALQRCPICAAIGRLRPRSGPSFVVTCDRCAAEWGLRVCECGSRTPYLRLSASSGAKRLGNVSDDLDLAVGRDVFAAPCLLDESTYPCRECGRCEGQAMDVSPCARCRGHALLTDAVTK